MIIPVETRAELNALAPDTVVTSSLANWDPDIDYILDQWWAHRVQGRAYAASMEEVWFPMAKGGTDLAPYHGWAARLPEALKSEIAARRDDILAGRRTIPLDLSPPKAHRETGVDGAGWGGGDAQRLRPGAARRPDVRPGTRGPRQ